MYIQILPIPDSPVDISLKTSQMIISVVYQTFNPNSNRPQVDQWR